MEKVMLSTSLHVNKLAAPSCSSVVHLVGGGFSNDLETGDCRHAFQTLELMIRENDQRVYQ